MPWNATKRWVFPSFRLVMSETRTPDERWVNGYAVRAYVDNLWIAAANGTWQPMSFAVTLWSGTAKPYLEFTFGGTLGGHESDEVRVLDHPGITLPSLGNATSGDIFVQWIGWFEIYASGDLQVSAWSEIYEKGDTEISGHTHVRTLDGFLTAMARPDNQFPDFPGRPTDVWNAERTGPNNPPPPPAEDARCPALRETIASLNADIADLQAQLQDAQPGQRQGLTAKIKKSQDDLKAATTQATSLGCHVP